jgi:hypothetical protein
MNIDIIIQAGRWVVGSGQLKKAVSKEIETASVMFIYLIIT